ncbi:Fur-regulated basic protein FbpA [Ectobacillus sp. sgz5001026]|uniref:Fur-regulated basic protein FbpA n=1 Tax=Ectobacillus sp. sgz5001026 TaxID=3242473 RepID=UPI0036D225C8
MPQLLRKMIEVQKNAYRKRIIAAGIYKVSNRSVNTLTLTELKQVYDSYQKVKSNIQN